MPAKCSSFHEPHVSNGHSKNYKKNPWNGTLQPEMATPIKTGRKKSAQIAAKKKKESSRANRNRWNAGYE